MNTSPGKISTVHGLKPKTWRGFVLVFFLITSCLMIPRLGVAEPVYVQVASTTLRAEPKHWAKAIVTLQYGDLMTVLEEREAIVPGWLQVRVGKKTGYVHRSSVTEKQVVVEGSRKGKLCLLYTSPSPRDS